jgi:hypothetical protein
VDGFAYDDFARTDELIAIGEQSVRAALPALKKKLGIMDPGEKPAKAAEAAVTKAPALGTPA